MWEGAPPTRPHAAWLSAALAQGAPRTSGRAHSRDSVNHVQAHLYAAVGVVGLRLGEAGHTVVTVPEDLDAATVILLGGERANRTLVTRQGWGPTPSPAPVLVTTERAPGPHSPGPGQPQGGGQPPQL